MIIIELYNETTTIQFLTQDEADAFLFQCEDTEDPHYQNLQQREVEIELPEE